MIRQLAFDLPAQSTYRREDFFVSPANALALAAVDGWRDWPERKMLLVGQDGAGKTHLAHVWAALSGAVVVAGQALETATLPDLAANGAVVVEDAHLVAGADADQPGAEAALFHLHNLMAAQGTLLLTAACPPRDWGLTLPDLVSRMQATPQTRLEPPDDALLSAVLIKLFADRQLAVSPHLVGYLVSHMPRSIGAARAVVARLDNLALAQGRSITRSMAAEVLDSLSPE